MELSLLNLIANTKFEKKIYNVLKPYFFEIKLRIVKVEFKKLKKPLLIVYVDKTSGKITVDECATIAEEVMYILNVEDSIKDDFRLEISSAGIDRSLTSLNDFEKYRNCMVKVKSNTNTDRGKLVDFSEADITIESKRGKKSILLLKILDIKVDLEGMSLNNIKKMELI